MSVYDASLQAFPRPRVTFLDLSRELRNYCYSLALTSPSPIIAWCRIHPEGPETIRAEWNFKRTKNPCKDMTSDERNTALNLLRGNSVIAHEAALIFYGKNKFVFAGDWTWETVATWFENIGLRNRTFITSIELWQWPPFHAWQMASGERVKVYEFDWDPWNHHFQEAVTCIAPQTRLLGLVGNERPSKLLLTFFLGQCLIPGLPLDLYDENCAHQWFTMELPNVAEKLRSIYTAGSMDVIWKGKFWKRRFQKQREIIESCWEIVELEEFDEARGVGRRAFTLPWIRFTLRSKELPELLLAEEPAPHSGWGFYSIQDDRTLIRFGPE